MQPGDVYCTDHPLTLEEFLELVDEDTEAELIDGVVVMSSPAGTAHETLFGWLLRVLGGYVEERRLGVVLGSRSPVRITGYTGREPDLLFVRAERCHIIQENEITEAPDFVIEIVSPNDRLGQVIRKQAQYETIGVRELWVIDLPRREVRAYVLGEDGRFASVPVSKGGVLRSAVVDGFELKVEWLWSGMGQFPSSLSIVQNLLKRARQRSKTVQHKARAKKTRR
ncbi:MAG: Uma2 family endonuclease [Abditibacteriales bacterium]|nr:Uma2 family endonuclease [Abditibacteriales bacterium]